jgi:NAD(P)-dependent dehydrogenase (short-subunit alcohol dehydrogenase family)
MFRYAPAPLAHIDGRVRSLTLDVTNAEQIQSAVNRVESLDVLINNAGIALYLSGHLPIKYWQVTSTRNPLVRFLPADRLPSTGETSRTDHGPILKEIAVGISLTRYPPRGPGRALIGASGSYRG